MTQDAINADIQIGGHRPSNVSAIENAKHQSAFLFLFLFPHSLCTSNALARASIIPKRRRKKKRKNGKGREKASLPRDTRKHHRGEGRPVPGEALRLRVLGGAWIVRSNLLAKDRPC